jgi:hypothetical protein
MKKADSRDSGWSCKQASAQIGVWPVNNHLSKSHEAKGLEGQVKIKRMAFVCWALTGQVFSRPAVITTILTSVLTMSLLYTHKRELGGREQARAPAVTTGSWPGMPSPGLHAHLSHACRHLMTRATWMLDSGFLRKQEPIVIIVQARIPHVPRSQEPSSFTCFFGV